MNQKINKSDQLNGKILVERREILKRYEAVALVYGDEVRAFRDRGGNAPVVIAPLIESQWNFQDSSSDVFNGMDSDFLESAVDRSGLTPDQLNGSIGVLNSAVGSAFEIDVSDMISQGDLQLPEGIVSTRLLGRTEPGADFEFLDSSGDVVALMNTKASSSYSIIAEHFLKHPEVNYVYATHDAAMAAAEHGYTVIDGASGIIPLTNSPIVIDAGMDSGQYRDALRDLAENSDGSFDSLLDGNSLIDNIPWITIGVLLYRARKRQVNGVELEDNKKALLRDSMRSGSVHGVSIALQAAGVPIPVTLAASLFSASAVGGIFRVKDEWGAMSAYESLLASRAESLLKS